MTDPTPLHRRNRYVGPFYPHPNEPIYLPDGVAELPGEMVQLSSHQTVYLLPTVGRYPSGARLYTRKTFTSPWELIGTTANMDLKTILEGIVARDVQTLVKKDADYGSSWKKRGGVGAFMMLARKWDRLETQATRKELDTKYDIFDAVQQDCMYPSDHPHFESTLETIRDLRAYLLLVESEMIARRVIDNYGVVDQDFKPTPHMQVVISNAPNKEDCERAITDLEDAIRRDVAPHAASLNIFKQLFRAVYPAPSIVTRDER